MVHSRIKSKVKNLFMSKSVSSEGRKDDAESDDKIFSQLGPGKGTSYTPSNISKFEDVRPPLRDGEIRLIRLSMRGPDQNQLMMQWESASLDEVPAFNALSYTWGPPSANPMMQLPGYKFTDNLMDCLLQISSKLPGLWWIDALCIIQNDLEEKSRQVKKMRDIYASAKRVYVWLGAEGGDGRLALQTLGKIYAQIPSGSTQDDEPKVSFDDEDLKRVGLPATDDTAWPSLMEFLSRPYFKRVWVIQELAVAPEDMYIMCGRITIPYKSFYHILRWLDTQNWKSVFRQMAFSHYDPSFDFGAFDLIDAVTVLRQFPGNFQLEFYIGLCSSFKSSDPRDKIIALLGLVSPEDEVLKRIEPNYGQPVAEFFRDVTGAAMICHQSYELLSLVGPRSESVITNLPSWVPDYSLDMSNQYFATGYHASGSTRFAAEWTSGSNILQVEAKISDQVDIVSDEAAVPGSKMAVLILYWLAMAANATGSDECQWLFSLADWQRPIIPEIDYFWRTITGNKHEAGDDSSPKLPDQYLWVFFSYIIPTVLKQEQWDVALKEKFAETLGTNPRVEKLMASDLRQEQETAFAEEFMNNTLDRTFLVTKQGRMGLGPKSMRSGDQVVILSGGGPIYFLREKGSCYEFLGDGYVHGLMNGEGLGKGPAFEKIAIE